MTDKPALVHIAECFRIGGWQDVGSAYRELSRGGRKGQDSQGGAYPERFRIGGWQDLLAALIESCQEQGA